MAEIRIGTSGWSYKDWEGNFYPKGLPAAQQLPYLAERFDCVEIDSTFYRIPSPTMVQRWHDATPEGFLFTCKFPHAITHDRHLVDCDMELEQFIDAVSRFDEKLGAVLLQLDPAFHADRFDDLKAFLGRLPADWRIAVEFRHRGWHTARTYDLLREHNAALAMVAHYYMPIVAEVTSDFAYVRWLGRRDQITKFDRTQIDRTEQMREWVGIIHRIEPHVNMVMGFFNNHWAGHSPESAMEFRQMLKDGV